jgi:hypothetical protein
MNRRLCMVTLAAVATAVFAGPLPVGAATSLTPATLTAATRHSAPLQVVYVPPGVNVTASSSSGAIQPNNTVIGTCGWSSMYLHNLGGHNVRFDADAGSYLGVIVRADWEIDWLNNTSGVDGAFWGTSIQFSPTWGVKRSGWTGAGTVYGTLVYLRVVLWNGVICQGLGPWDWVNVP